MAIFPVAGSNGSHVGVMHIALTYVSDNNDFEQ